jgi:serine/threonine protein kinase
MTGFPVPDFGSDTDDDMPFRDLSPVPPPRLDLTRQDFTELSAKSGLTFNPEERRSSTSNSYVYVAQSADGRRWAVKITPHASRAELEASNRKALPENEFIVWTVDIFLVRSKALLQMELCEDGDLNSILGSMPDHRLPERDAWQLLFNIANAFIVLHERGWMHLDVSPGNILRGGGLFKLADFGTLTKIGHFAEGNEGAGPYVSPEALAFPNSEFEVNGQTDIFSFGVVMLEMVTGRLAPRGGTSTNYLPLRCGEIQLGSGRYECDCSMELRVIVNEMLARDPSERPTARDLLERATAGLASIPN